MKLNPSRSFQSRLTLIMLLLVFLTTGSLLVVNYQIERGILIDQIRHRGVLMGRALQFSLTQRILQSTHNDLAAIPDDERREIRDFIRHFGEEEAQFDIYAQEEGVHDLFFIDTRGEVTIDYPSDKEGRVLPAEERITPSGLARLQRNQILSQITSRGRDTILLLTFPVIRDGQLAGFGRVEMSMNPAVALLSQIKFWGLAAAITLFLVAIVLAAYLARSVNRPIAELVDAAGRVGAGELTLRLKESSQDEIGILKTAFNRMVDGIVKLEQTQKRVERSEVASQLAARMAHEIKNPLNSIGLSVDYLRDRFTPLHDQDRAAFGELADNIKTELGRLNEIVERFLRFAKPGITAKRPVEIPSLVQDTLRFILPEAERTGVQVASRLAGATARVDGDDSQLRQALLNLFINALQAMPDGGILDVTSGLSASGEMEVVVRDNGSGIAPENLSRLFDPYFTTKVRGFGLGLTVVERIVQEHGGTIEVASEQGKGTAFTIRLPAYRMEGSVELCTT